MPVVVQKGAQEGARSDGAIEIAIVNNMPDSALESTEHQFIELLAAVSGETQLRVSLVSLPQITRGDLARRRLHAEYADISCLQGKRLDGIIVTGMEPGPGPLTDEPYWRAFADLIDWAERNTTSSIWSCLAAHAVVLHRDGIARRPLAAKCFGVYECLKQTDHPLLAGGAVRTFSPHSRWNDVPEDALVAAGYTILTRSPEIGVDTFVKDDRSLIEACSSCYRAILNTIRRPSCASIAGMSDGSCGASAKIIRRYHDTIWIRKANAACRRFAFVRCRSAIPNCLRASRSTLSRSGLPILGKTRRLVSTAIG
jgi:homoserine O-succinyltransferase